MFSDQEHEEGIKTMIRIEVQCTVQTYNRSCWYNSYGSLVYMGFV